MGEASVAMRRYLETGRHEIVRIGIERSLPPSGEVRKYALLALKGRHTADRDESVKVYLDDKEDCLFALEHGPKGRSLAEDARDWACAGAPFSASEGNDLRSLQDDLEGLLGARAAGIRLSGQSPLGHLDEDNRAGEKAGRISTLEVPAKIAGLLNAEHELPDMLAIACAEAAGALMMPAASVFLYEEAAGALVWAADFGLPSGYRNQARPIPLWRYEGLTQRVGAIFSTVDLPDLPEAQPHPSVGIRTLVGIGLRHRAELVGTLHLMSFEPREFANDELDLLRAIANPVAKALARARARARLLEQGRMEAIGNLAGGIAHLLNNLLVPIVGTGKLLLEGWEIGDVRREDIEEMYEAGQRAAYLTQQLLAFSQRQPLQPRVLDINGLLDGMRDSIERLLGEDVDLVIMQDPSLLPAEVDSAQLEQVIANLATNAREAMPQGGKLTIKTANAGPESEGTTDRGSLAPDPRVMIAVSDTGAGMDEGTRSRIFEPFFTTKGPGTHPGLGLATSYGIVRQSGGDIAVASRPSQGSTFTISFPAAEGRKKEPPPSGQGGPDPPSGTETVLVVEDEDPVRRFVTRVLRRQGYVVMEAASGPEALELLVGAPPIDLLLTDMVLPGLGGREVAEAVGAAVPGVRSLFMSGYTRNSIVHGGRLDQGIAFLQKPFTPEILMRMVREVLDEGRPPKEGRESVPGAGGSSTHPAQAVASGEMAVSGLTTLCAPAAGTPQQKPPASSGQTQGTTRASMRVGLTELFRNTEWAPPLSPTTPAPSAPATAGEPGPPVTEPSVFLRRFLHQAARSPELAPSGLANLDARLAGGFGSGLHLVQGRPGVGKTAFLESVAWEAISLARPVLYYALKEGSIGGWERLISTLGHILGGPAIPLGALRARTLGPDDLETLTRLDLAFQASVLPCLSLVETIPASTGTLSAFIEDVRSRAQETRERSGRTPLLLIDDLERLLLFTRARPLVRLLSRLDDALAADSIPGLLALTPPDRSASGLERLPAQTALALVSLSASANDAFGRVDLEVRTNARTGWTGTLPLLFDRRSGLFTHPPISTEREPVSESAD